MNMIVEGYRPLLVERTRIFASDVIAMAQMQRAIDYIIGHSDIRPSQMAKLAKLAVDASELAKTGISTERLLSGVAVSAGEEDHASGGIEYAGLYALDLERKSLDEAMTIWRSRAIGSARATEATTSRRNGCDGTAVVADDECSNRADSSDVVVSFPMRLRDQEA